MGALSNAHSQDWPTKTVRIINPSTAGGPSDILARTLSERFTGSMGQTFIVENKAGANGIIGINFVAKSPPDGYTLLSASSGMFVMNSALSSQLPFNPLKDFSPISIVVSSPFAIVVHPSLPVKTIAELVGLAKRNPEKITYGSFGSGSFPHLAMALFLQKTKTQMLHVPYKGGALMAMALVSGEVSVGFNSLQNQLSFIQTNRVRALAVTAKARLSLLPNTPTLLESGFANAELPAWYGFFAPAGTPRTIINRLYEDIKLAFNSNELRLKFTAQGSEIVLNSPMEFSNGLKKEIDDMRALAVSAKIKID